MPSTLQTDRDPNGIKQIYPTSSFGFNNKRRIGYNGWEYHADVWNKNRIYEFIPDGSLMPAQNEDLYLHYSKTPKSFVIVKGDGSISINTDEKYNTFKLSIYDDNNLWYKVQNALTNGKRWTSNVEFTFYFNIKAYPLTFGKKGGIEIHLTNDHHFLDRQQFSSGSNPYNAHDYYLTIQYDGHMYLSGEPYHGSTRDKKPDGIFDIDFWDTDFTGIPLNTLYGIKFIKKVINSKNVFLEVYRDTTGGADGGTWVKMFEFLHVRGNWYNTGMDLPYAAALANPTTSVLPIPLNVDDPHADGGGGQCYISFDPIHEIDIKWLSCRDIEPNLNPPITTDAELLESEFYNELTSVLKTRTLLSDIRKLIYDVNTVPRFDVETAATAPILVYSITDNGSRDTFGNTYKRFGTKIGSTSHPMYNITPVEVKCTVYRTYSGSTGYIYCRIYDTNGTTNLKTIGSVAVSSLPVGVKTEITFQNLTNDTGLELNQYLSFDYNNTTYPLYFYFNSANPIANCSYYYYSTVWNTISTEDLVAKVYRKP